MPLASRIPLYREIEKLRGRPLIVYATSSRPNASGAMAPDALPHFLDQILALPKDCKQADLLVVSNGGAPTVAWRIMSLLREKVSHVGVLVPQAAFSAATLLALGADEIVMHPCGNLGPVDPQITVPRHKPGSSEKEYIQFGSEDLAGFLRFVRDNVGLSDQEHLKSAFELFCKEAGAVPIGVAARAAQLSASMCAKLLGMHMKDSEAQKARTIAETLNTKFFHHGYPVGRKEAQEIGLKVILPEEKLEQLMWNTWLDLEAEMQCRTPFNPLNVLEGSPAAAAALFAPIPQINIPSGLPQNITNQALQAVLTHVSLQQTSPVDFQVVLAILESPRRAGAYFTRGKLFGRREVDLKISVNTVPLFSGWAGVDIPSV